MAGDKADETPAATGVKALLTPLLSTWGGASVLLEYDTAASLAVLPNQYVLWSLSRRFGGSVRGSAQVGTVGWRLSLRVVAKTVAGARELRTALNGIEAATVTAGGVTSTPITFESADDIGPDDGYFSALSTWTFVL